MPIFINFLAFVPMLIALFMLYGDGAYAGFAGYVFLGLVMVLDVVIIQFGNNKSIETKLLNSLSVLSLFVYGVVFAILHYMRLLPENMGDDFQGAIFIFSAVVALIPLLYIFKTKTEESKMNFFTKIGLKSRGIPFLLIGGLLLWLSLSAYIKNQAFLKIANSSTAKVINFAKINAQNGVTYAPVFEFRDKQERLHQVQSHTSSSYPLYEINQSIDILFDPQNPNEAKIDKPFEIWGAFLIMSLVGVLFFSVGVILFVLKIEYNMSRE